jgi:8-oxo-dGTP diphosphatase
MIPRAPAATVVVPSVFVAVRWLGGPLLLVRRCDSGVRETAEEAGVQVLVTGLVGLFTDPGTVVRSPGGEVRQQFAVLFRARPVKASPRRSARDQRGRVVALADRPGLQGSQDVPCGLNRNGFTESGSQDAAGCRHPPTAPLNQPAQQYVMVRARLIRGGAPGIPGPTAGSSTRGDAPPYWRPMVPWRGRRRHGPAESRRRKHEQNGSIAQRRPSQRWGHRHAGRRRPARRLHGPEHRGRHVAVPVLELHLAAVALHPDCGGALGSILWIGLGVVRRHRRRRARRDAREG